jgi:hypothetical protein
MGFQVLNKFVLGFGIQIPGIPIIIGIGYIKKPGIPNFIGSHDEAEESFVRELYSVAPEV